MSKYRMFHFTVMMAACATLSLLSVLHFTTTKFADRSCDEVHKTKTGFTDRSCDEVLKTNEVQESERRTQLRLNYTKLDRLSSLAKKVEAMQGNCSLTKIGIARQRNNAGLGSDIHIYSVALCKGLELNNVRVRTIGPWIWNDEKHCQAYDNAIDDPWKSPITCYFPESENACPKQDSKFDEIQLQDRQRTVNLTREDGKVFINSCRTIRQNFGGTAAVRAATTEFLFTRVADRVQREGQRQLELVFGINGTHGSVPNNLITVHIRWGDKRRETSLLPITPYIEAVHDILALRRHVDGMMDPENAEEEDVNIFLSTEDPDAVEQFMTTKPHHWNVFVDQYYVEYLPFRQQSGNQYNNHVTNAVERGSQMGLVALGSLLVAMEANDFVLTTASNWSRLMNEIRKNIIDPRCGGCTRMIDLNYFEER